MSSNSPFSHLGLEGYSDEVSVHPGDAIQFMVSGPKGAVHPKIVHLQHGDPNPEGPGFKASEVGWGAPREIVVEPQAIDFGSFIEVSAQPILNPTGSFTLAMWYLPTRPRGWQALAAKFAPNDLGYGLFCSGLGVITAFVSRDGIKADWISGRAPAESDHWNFAALTYGAETGEMSVFQCVAGGGASISRSGRRIGRGLVHRSAANLLFGATEGSNGELHRCHFNGKLADPVLFEGVVEEENLQLLATGVNPSTVAPVVAAWDFSSDVFSSVVRDTGPHSCHGRAVNAPARAVTGPSWAGGHAARFTDNPQAYRAVHLHDDDLEDARWEPSFELIVPSDIPSGLYAAVIESEVERIVLPFAVTPSVPSGEVLVLLPTLTWQAYSSTQQVWASTEDGVVDRGLCIYDWHNDGSPVYYCSRRKPSRAWDPTRGFRLWGAHLQTASLYLLDWLDEKRLGYEVISDQDLHAAGGDVLAGCRCLIVAGHPEYWTRPMMEAFAAFTRRGGRVMYLGGNGFYWVTSIDSARPHLMEVRKSGEGDIDPRTVAAPGEVQHSTTLELGGLWSRRGFSPRRLVGVEFSANWFEESHGAWGFERTRASHEERFEFVFEGVGEEVIGDFGLNLGTAAAFEVDSVQEWWWDGEQPVTLARAAPGFLPLMNAPAAPVADLAFMSLPNGGAVFSAGSVTWTGSLSYNGYQNNVSRITENVLRRFLAVPPNQRIG